MRIDTVFLGYMGACESGRGAWRLCVDGSDGDPESEVDPGESGDGKNETN